MVLTKRSRDRYPISHLGPLLQAFGAWTCSSSGVEQNFSVDKWLVAKRPLAVQHELDHLQIVISGCDDKKLLKESAAVWTALYGRPRCSKRRLRGYSKKKQSLKVPSLSRVLQARRKAAGKRAAAGHRPVEEVANMAIEVAGECWTEKHKAESQRQKGLKLDRQIDAFEKNQLLEHECEGLEAQSQLRQQRVAVRKRQRENEQARLAEKMSRPNFNLFGHTCWIQPTCGFNPEKINEILLEHHMRRHQHEQSVDLFVVPDIASPPPEIQVLAAMRGSIVGSPQFFSSGGQVGCCIGFWACNQTDQEDLHLRPVLPKSSEQRGCIEVDVERQRLGNFAVSRSVVEGSSAKPKEFEQSLGIAERRWETAASGPQRSSVCHDPEKFLEHGFNRGSFQNCSGHWALHLKAVGCSRHGS